ncbi:hypothetical protein KUTeg_022653 [Tegillarca granosa]|uniref:PHD and RING finger domain-containing protein 1 n=1 Tax=Tegillarca granosa TaxID=220873 RepID=A0ABQ9DZE4_TEGGR|nr:hypothetical protein KUTeg_022653 [Tegillarca granosa]
MKKTHTQELKMDMFADDSNSSVAEDKNQNTEITENVETAKSKEPQDTEMSVEERDEEGLGQVSMSGLGDENQDNEKHEEENTNMAEKNDENANKEENNVNEDISMSENDGNVNKEVENDGNVNKEEVENGEHINIEEKINENESYNVEENNERESIKTEEQEFTNVDEDNELNEGERNVEEKQEKEFDIEEEEGEEDDESEGDEEDDDGEEIEEGDDDDGDEETDDDDEDDDDEEDDDETEEEDENEITEETAALAESDEDAEGCENCPICLCKLKYQDIGTPESCDHCFCLECIQEWAKITVEDKKMDEETEEEESPTYCEICGDCNREDRLLLCDGCDSGYHCECLDPPLDTIPVEEWFCPECAELNRPDQRAAEVVDDDDEIRFIITENDTLTSTLRPRRMIARTRVSERVRANLEQMRLQRSRRFTRPEIVDSGDDEEQSEPEASSSSVSRPSTTRRTPKKTTGRKYKRKSTKRKITKRKSTKSTKRRTVKKGTTTRKRKGGKRKRRRKVKKVVKKEKAVPVVSVKSRLAKSLGLSKPPTGRTIPLQKTPGEKSTDVKRTDFGVTPLSILGHKDELIAFQDEEPTTSDSTVQTKPTVCNSRYSKSSLQSRFPLVKPRTKKFSAVVKPVVSDAASSSSPLDILGSIMQDQTKLHLASEKITINRDGSLTEKESQLKKEKTKVESDNKVNKKELSYNQSTINSSDLYAGIDDDDADDDNQDKSDNVVKPVASDINKEDNSYPTELFEDKWTLGVTLSDKEDNSVTRMKSKVTDVTKSNHGDRSKEAGSNYSTSVKSNVMDDCKFLDLEISHRSSRRSSSESKESGEITQEQETVSVKNSQERKSYKKSPTKSESKFYKESYVKNDSSSSKKEKYDHDITSKDSDKNDDESGPERSVFKKKGKINISINFRDNSALSKDEESADGDHDNYDTRKSDHGEKSRSHKSSHESQKKKSSKSEHRKSSSHTSRDKDYNYSEDNSHDTVDVDFENYDAGKIPVSEFPKIPKRKKQDVDDDVVEVIVIDDSDVQRSDYDSRGSSEKKRKDKRDEDYDDRWRKGERDRSKYKDDHRTDYYRKEKEESSRKDREGHHRSRERDRDDHRHKHKKDRHRERSRSHSRERKNRERSRSRERGRRSRSRERIARSRSRERKRHSRSRSKERTSRKHRSEKNKDRSYRSKSPSHREEDIFKTKSPRKDRIEKDNLLYHSMKQKKQLEKADKHVVEEDKNSDDVILVQEKDDNSKNQGDHLEMNETDSVEKLNRDNKTNSETSEVSKIEVVTGAKRPSENSGNTKEFKKFKVDKSDSLIVVKDKDVMDGNVDFTEKMDSLREAETRDCANIQVVVGMLDNNNKDKVKTNVSGGITQLSEEYDPACPTDDALGQTPTPPPQDLGLLPPPPMADNLGAPVNFPAHILEEGHRLSPLPGQGILGEGGPFLVPSGERPALLQQPQNMVPPSTIPGQPGAIPRLNGPGGLQMHPNDLTGQPGGMPPPHAGGLHIHPGGIPGQSGPLNGAEFEHLPPDPNGPPPHFPPHLLQHPSELPMGDPRFTMPLGQPNPLLQHLNPLEPPEHGGPPPASLPDGISTNLVPISLSASIPNISSSLPNISSSVAPINSSQTEVSPALHQIQQITKLLNTQHQLALLSKDKEESEIHSGISQENWDSKKENSPPMKSGRNKSGEKNVFKVPFPPNLSQSNQKSKSNSDNGVLKNKDVDMETTEVIDMDMSSPLDEGNIEIADSPEFDNIIFGYKRESSSKKDSDSKNVKKDTSDGSSDRKNKENISKVRFKDDKSVHSSSSSVNKSKSGDNKVKSSKEKTSSKEKDNRKSHRERKHRHEHRSHKPTASEKKFDEIMNDFSSQDEIPSSAVELTNKEKRVVDEVKVALKPFYSSRKINKEQYKDILRRAVPKVCHSKSGDINPVKIKSLVEAYVEKFIRNSRKKESPGALKSNVLLISIQKMSKFHI